VAVVGGLAELSIADHHVLRRHDRGADLAASVDVGGKPGIVEVADRYVAAGPGHAPDDRVEITAARAAILGLVERVAEHGGRQAARVRLSLERRNEARPDHRYR
jgi:hypothetical protein